MSSPIPSPEELFAAALELTDPAARSAYLEQRCAGHPALREEVETLLAAHDRGGGFLATETLPKTLPADHLTGQAGDRIDRYRLLEQIGEGGFGVVWMAEQEEPVRRRVALKVIKLGMDTRDVVARFEAERQALALMDHPSIARVFDGGITPDGRPYFVMELVRGVPITRYCDDRLIATEDRLRLFIQVCEAVQHAHQKGIIHRDLKPTNILVTDMDGRALAKVIDFGVAKATSQRLTEKTLFTRLGQMVGTPAYMSPEQAGLGGLDIDTRSDVYALGVILYELLTGRTPFNPKELLEAGYAAILKTIREVEPPKPSTRLKTLAQEELETVAQRRHLEPQKLGRLVRGDLDWIVMKCLEKDRARRYETANGLAMDLLRHLNAEPVLAQQPGRLYRFRKMVRRHRIPMAAAAVVSVTLVLGAGASVWQAIRATQSQQLASGEAKRSTQIATFLAAMLKGVGPSVAKGRDTVMLREILDRTAERLGEELTDAPEVEVSLRTTLATVYGDLGEEEKAVDMFRRALAKARTLPGIQGGTTLEEADLLHGLGGALLNQRKLDEAEPLLRQALATYRFNASAVDGQAAVTLGDLANALQFRGRLDEAEAMHRQALAEKTNIFGQVHLEVADSMGCLGNVLRELNRPAEAEPYLRQAVATRTQLAGEDDPRVAEWLDALALALGAQGKLVEAEETGRKALRLERLLHKEVHPMLAITLNNLASIVWQAGKLPEAEELLRESLSVQRKLGELKPAALDAALSNLAGLALLQGKLVEAESLMREVQALYPNTAPPPELLGRLATVVDKQGRHDEAEALFRQRLKVYEAGPAGNWLRFAAQGDLGRNLAAQRKLDQAEPLLLSAYEGLNQCLAQLSPMSRLRIPRLLEALVELHEATGRSDQAAEWKRKLERFQETGDKPKEDQK